MGKFQGKRIWITGASSGIGASLARKCVEEGAHVGLSARRESLLESLSQEIGNCAVAPCDVTNQDSLHFAAQKIIGAFGGIDIVIANAGFGVHGSLSQLTTADFQRQFDVNYFGVVRTALVALPYLKDSKGHLVVVASVLGRFGYPFNSAYCSSKFALNGFCESIAYELNDAGVHVTCINPGLVDSNISRVDNENVFHTGREDSRPKSLMVPTDQAASEILVAIYKQKREAVITRHGRWSVRFNQWLPRTFRWLMARYLHPKRHAQKKEAPAASN